MTTDLSALEALAKKAKEDDAVMRGHRDSTHGPWPSWCNDCLIPGSAVTGSRSRLAEACSPDTILSLIEELREARKLAEHFQATLREAEWFVGMTDKKIDALRTQLKAAERLAEYLSEHEGECPMCASLSDFRSTEPMTQSKGEA